MTALAESAVGLRGVDPGDGLTTLGQALGAPHAYLLMPDRGRVISSRSSPSPDRGEELLRIVAAPGRRPAPGRVEQLRLPDATFAAASGAAPSGEEVVVAIERGDGEPDPDAARGLIIGTQLLAARSGENAAGAEAERRARAILAATLNAVVTIDAEGIIVEFNPAAERVFGHRREEVMGGQLADILIPPDYRDAHRKGLARYLSTGEGPALNRPLNLPALTADGRLIQIELVIAPLDLDGERLFTGFARDVTADLRRESELKTATSRLEALIANFSAGVLVEDEERRIVLINRELMSMFGIDGEPEAMAGADCAAAAEASSALFADPPAFLEGVDRRLRQRTARVGEELAAADGRTFERDYLPIFVDDVYRGHLWLYRDISRRKDAEEEREALLSSERESRVALQAATERLAEQNRELTELDRLRTELVATVSHELRTPLTSIVSLSGLLADPSGPALDDEQREFVEIIERNAGRLLRVIDDLLLLARLDAGRFELELEDVDIAALVRASAAALAPDAVRREVELTIDVFDGPPLLGDPERLGQVLDNLISNALKFTPAQGEVSVTAGPHEDGWSIEVQDTGPGIPPGEIDRLFQRFFRASTSQGGEGGSGLGLAIVKGIVDRHGGRVTVDSAPGLGSTFRVEIPGVPPASRP